jgi:hypothetical protein
VLAGDGRDAKQRRAPKSRHNASARQLRRARLENPLLSAEIPLHGMPAPGTISLDFA